MNFKYEPSRSIVVSCSPSSSIAYGLFTGCCILISSCFSFQSKVLMSSGLHCERYFPAATCVQNRDYRDYVYYNTLSHNSPSPILSPLPRPPPPLRPKFGTFCTYYTNTGAEPEQPRPRNSSAASNFHCLAAAPLELQRRFAKISQSRRRPLLRLFLVEST